MEVLVSSLSSDVSNFGGVEVSFDVKSKCAVVRHSWEDLVCGDLWDMDGTANNTIVMLSSEYIQADLQCSVLYCWRSYYPRIHFVLAVCAW